MTLTFRSFFDVNLAYHLAFFCLSFGLVLAAGWIAGRTAGTSGSSNADRLEFGGPAVFMAILLLDFLPRDLAWPPDVAPVLIGGAVLMLCEIFLRGNARVLSFARLAVAGYLVYGDVRPNLHWSDVPITLFAFAWLAFFMHAAVPDEDGPNAPILAGITAGVSGFIGFLSQNSVVSMLGAIMAGASVALVWRHDAALRLGRSGRRFMGLVLAMMTLANYYDRDGMFRAAPALLVLSVPLLHHALMWRAAIAGREAAPAHRGLQGLLRERGLTEHGSRIVMAALAAATGLIAVLVVIFQSDPRLP
jgi:hypothetical protein